MFGIANQCDFLVNIYSRPIGLKAHKFRYFNIHGQPFNIDYPVFNNSVDKVIKDNRKFLYEIHWYDEEKLLEKIKNEEIKVDKI